MMSSILTLKLDLRSQQTTSSERQTWAIQYSCLMYQHWLKPVHYTKVKGVETRPTLVIAKCATLVREQWGTFTSCALDFEQKIFIWANKNVSIACQLCLHTHSLCLRQTHVSVPSTSHLRSTWPVRPLKVARPKKNTQSQTGRKQFWLAGLHSDCFQCGFLGPLTVFGWLLWTENVKKQIYINPDL